MSKTIWRRLFDVMAILLATVAFALAVALAHGTKADFDWYLRYRLPFALLGLIFLSGWFMWANWRGGFVAACCIALAAFGPMYCRLLQERGLWPQMDSAGWSMQYVIMTALVMLASICTIPHWGDWQTAVMLRWQARGGMVTSGHSSTPQGEPHRHWLVVGDDDSCDRPTMVS